MTYLQEQSFVLYADDILLYHLIVSENDYILLQRDVDALGVWPLILQYKEMQIHDTFMKENKTHSSLIILLGSQLDIAESIKYLELFRQFYHRADRTYH